MKDRPCGYYFLPLPSKQEDVWIDKTCYFYAEKTGGAIDGSSPDKQMKIKIDFYANPAKEETKETYYFDDLCLARMKKAPQPAVESSSEVKAGPETKAAGDRGRTQ